MTNGIDPLTITVVTNPVIAAGQSLSSVFDLGATKAIRGIVFPAQWSHGAPLTFQASVDNVTFYDIYRPSGEMLQIKVVPGGMMMMEKDIWQRFSFRFRSGTPASPAVQHQARTFICMLE